MAAAYDLAVFVQPEPELFGKGSLEGLTAAEVVVVVIGTPVYMYASMQFVEPIGAGCPDTVGRESPAGARPSGESSLSRSPRAQRRRRITR